LLELGSVDPAELLSYERYGNDKESKEKERERERVERAGKKRRLLQLVNFINSAVSWQRSSGDPERSVYSLVPPS